MQVAVLWVGYVGWCLSLFWRMGGVLLGVGSFCRCCCCLNGFVLLNKRVHASLAAANLVTGLDIIFDCWGFTLYVHGGVQVGVLFGDWCVFR